MGVDAAKSEQDAAPELREQVSAARDRVAELLLIVVGIAGGVGLVTNLLVTFAHDGALTPTEWVVLLGAAGFTLLLALLAAVRSRQSTRELDEEIELAIPILVPGPSSTGHLEVIEMSGYKAITELGHAAVAKLPMEQATSLAQASRRIDRGASPEAPPLTLIHGAGTSEEDGDEDEPASTASLTAMPVSNPLVWFLQLTQLIVAAQCLDESERLLGPGALFHRGRWLRRRTPHLRDITWESLLGAAGQSQPFATIAGLPGVRQRTTIPAAARIELTNVAEELVESKRRMGRRRPRADQSAAARAEEGQLIPLLRLDAGRAGSLTINGINRISAHAAPRIGQPAAGLTTRVFLRNARDPQLRQRALEEELLASLRADGGVPRPGMRLQPLDLLPAGAAPENLQAEHARAWRALYRGGRRPKVVRVYLTVQGRFRVRLTGRGSVSDQALYSWATALAQRVGTLDIDVFMARLAAHQQLVPERRY
ncbi:MAG TPA: hypothetical protein VGN32_12610 [Ktedonobacterales bacterium]|nr:hypothetical protein [Ktedonobacterales bacterium]